MKHRMNTRSRLVSRSFVECFSLLALLVFWSVGMSQEVSAAVLYPIGDRPIAVSAPANADRWDIDDQVDAETVDRQTVLSLTTSPADLVRALAISYHELTAVGWRSIFEVDHEAWGFTVAVTLQGRPGHGPLLLSIGPVKLASSSPIMPLASSPSSVLLFLPGLVGLLGVLLREQHRLTWIQLKVLPAAASFTSERAGSQAVGSPWRLRANCFMRRTTTSRPTVSAYSMGPPRCAGKP